MSRIGYDNLSNLLRNTVRSCVPIASTTSANCENDPVLCRLRLRQANRHSVVPVPARLEDLIPQDHLARLIWEVVKRLDLYTTGNSASNCPTFITGVDVVNTGSDKAQMEPMIEQVIRRTGQIPKNWLIEDGFVKLTVIELVKGLGTIVFGPVPEPKDKTRDPYVPLATNSDIIAEWRRRMGTEEG